MNYEFIRRMIYENEKDTPFTNSEDFYKKIRQKYKINLYLLEVYKKIINYQISKYGSSLQYKPEFYIREELIKMGRNARGRRYERRRRNKKR